MERMRKTVLYLTSFLLLGVFSCIVYHSPGKKHTEKQNGVSTDPGRKYISAAVVCEIGRLVPLMEKTYTYEGNCHCFPPDSGITVPVSVLCALLGRV